MKCDSAERHMIGTLRVVNTITTIAGGIIFVGLAAFYVAYAHMKVPAVRAFFIDNPELQTPMFVAVAAVIGTWLLTRVLLAASGYGTDGHGGYDYIR